MGITLPQKRGIYVILISAIIIMLFIIGRLFNENRNFDNANVNGVYLGHFYIQTLGTKNIELTFNGAGLVTSRFWMADNETQIDGEYICQSPNIYISLQSDQMYINFMGTIDSNYVLISGNAQLGYFNGTIYNGTLSITKN